MKKLIILLLLLFLILLLGCPVFPKEQQKVLYNCNGLTITKKKASYNGKVLYDALKKYKELCKYGDVDKIECFYTPLSIIGSYYSYQYDMFDNGSGGCQFTTNQIVVVTIDVRTNQPVSVLNLIDEASLVVALKEDQWVRNNIGDLKQLDACQTFKDTIEVIGNTDRRFDGIISQYSFAFARLNQKNGFVALRLIRVEDLGWGHYKTLELGLWVKPKRGMEKLFLQKSNFYLGDF